jgi:hypothetical protein
MQVKKLNKIGYRMILKIIYICSGIALSLTTLFVPFAGGYSMIRVMVMNVGGVYLLLYLIPIILTIMAVIYLYKDFKFAKTWVLALVISGLLLSVLALREAVNNTVPDVTGRFADIISAEGKVQDALMESAINYNELEKERPVEEMTIAQHMEMSQHEAEIDRMKKDREKRHNTVINLLASAMGKGKIEVGGWMLLCLYSMVLLLTIIEHLRPRKA